MSAPRTEIVVDELVVLGLTPPEARAVAAALEARLAAALGEAVAGAVWRGVAGRGAR